MVLGGYFPSSNVTTVARSKQWLEGHHALGVLRDLMCAHLRVEE